MTSDEMLWHKDGHKMHLQLNKENLVITHVTCPGGECQHKGQCIVEWFLRRFGLDCNVGVAPPEENMEIAWCLVGETENLDLSQIWVIPISDEAFSAWLITQG